MATPSALAERTAPRRDPQHSSAAGRRSWPRIELWILITAVVAVLSAALMPLAPVSMNSPTVSWPQDPSAAESTDLQLSTALPRSITATFSCAAATAAQDADGVLLATILPGRPSETEGLLVRAEAGELRIVSDNVELYRGDLPAGDCAYTLSLTADSTRLSLDGRPLVDEPVENLPDVDVLATSVTSLPGATADDLGVTVEIDDQWSTSPTTLKWLIALVLVVSSLACLVLVFRWDRQRRATAPARRRGSWVRQISVVDVAVGLLLVAWTFIAPMTDDDGYYAAMARNALDNGYVGNYYQLWNQGYTPFTWFYQLLGYWDLLGSSPVVLRIPALVSGLLTYAVVRAVVESVGLPAAATTVRRLARHAVIGLVFAMAWLPYAMGVRPEGMVGLLAVLSLGAVIVARRRGSLGWFSLSLLVAGLAITCHPTGVVALAPWLASIAAMWPYVRTTGAVRTVARGLGVVAPAAISAIPGFLDGSLNDFLASDKVFQRWPNNTWYEEQLRYQFLLGGGPMGAYAKRAIILVGIVALVWFLVLQLAAAGRRTRQWPPLVALTGYSYGLALLLLWLTPSKWTHHFGAISGLGAVFISCMLLHVVRVAVAAQRGRRTVWPVVVLVALSLVVAFALSMHGNNTWAYSWMIAIPHSFESPYISGISLDSPAVWAVVVLGLGALVAWRMRRSGSGRTGAARVAGTAGPLAVVAFLLAGFVYMVGGFAYATVTTLDDYSPWADALRDPLARDCGAEGAIAAPDPGTARPLATATGGTEADGFLEDSGYHPTSPPPQAAQGAPPVWGSYPELGGESNTGTLTTGWYALPEDAGDDVLLVEVSGRLTRGNELRAEYGTQSGSDVEQVGDQRLDDDVDSTIWRQLLLDAPEDADVVRLVASDDTGGPGGWLATTAPLLVEESLLSQQVPADATVGVSWQFSFLFPCAAQPEVVHGMSEPSDYIYAWGEGGISSLGDNIYSRGRGGLFHPTVRSGAMTLLAARMVDHPEVRAFQIFQVQNPYADDAYDLDVQRVDRWGWQGY